MNYQRLTLQIVGILLVSLLLHFVINGTLFTLESVSNNLFVVSILSFLMALIMQSGAYQIFYGFRYSFRVLVSREYHKKYPNYSDYREEQLQKPKPGGITEFLIAASVLLVISIILGYLV